MRVRIHSDIHMEQFVHATVPCGFKWHEAFVPPREHDAESVLILAGDICEFQHVFFFANMWKELAKRFKAIVYVPGNHEYFGNTSPYGKNTFFYMKELLRKYGNIHLLDNTSVTIDGQRFYGATLWTNYGNSPIAELACMKFPEFRWALDDNNGAPRVPVPGDYVNRFNTALDGLKTELAKNEDVIVVTHFAPSYQSIHERYKATSVPEINLHFASNLDDLILGNPNIKLWVHGHTHTQFDYMIGDTRIVCNPSGYANEDTDKQADLDYINV